MTWARFEGDFPQHPKVWDLSAEAFRLHASGICHCARYLTDGLVKASVVPSLVPDYDRAYLTELVKAELWAKKGDAYEIHDYLQWNRTKAQIKREVEAKRSGGRKGAKVRWS